MSIVRLTYFSEFRINPEIGSVFSQIGKILDSCEKWNTINNISGALVFDSNWFVQILEGELDDVWATYQRIRFDSRHANIRFVEMLTVPSRRFGNWRMACAERIGEGAAIFAPYLMTENLSRLI